MHAQHDAVFVVRVVPRVDDMERVAVAAGVRLLLHPHHVGGRAEAGNHPEPYGAARLEIELG